jgi:Flp pilus assembly protein TadG
MLMEHSMNKRQKGQSMMEFALVLGVLVGVIGLLVFVGDVFRRIEVLENAASEGGRAAQVWRPGTGKTCVQAVTDAVKLITPLDVTVQTSSNCPNNTTDRIGSGDTVKVTVIHTWEPIFFGTLFLDIKDPPHTITYKAEVTDRHE